MEVVHGNYRDLMKKRRGRHQLLSVAGSGGPDSPAWSLCMTQKERDALGVSFADMEAADCFVSDILDACRKAHRKLLRAVAAQAQEKKRRSSPMFQLQVEQLKAFRENMERENT